MQRDRVGQNTLPGLRNDHRRLLTMSPKLLVHLTLLIGPGPFRVPSTTRFRNFISEMQYKDPRRSSCRLIPSSHCFERQHHPVSTCSSEPVHLTSVNIYCANGLFITLSAFHDTLRYVTHPRRPIPVPGSSCRVPRADGWVKSRLARPGREMLTTSYYGRSKTLRIPSFQTLFPPTTILHSLADPVHRRVRTNSGSNYVQQNHAPNLSRKGGCEQCTDQPLSPPNAREAW